MYVDNSTAWCAVLVGANKTNITAAVTWSYRRLSHNTQLFCHVDLESLICISQLAGKPLNPETSGIDIDAIAAGTPDGIASTIKYLVREQCIAAAALSSRVPCYVLSQEPHRSDQYLHHSASHVGRCNGAL